MNTVGDLRVFVRDRGVSPESLALEVGISNMTIRRLLGRKDADPLPSKYAILFSGLATTAALAGDFKPFVDQLASDGEKASPDDVLRRLREKLKSVGIPGPLRRHVRMLRTALGAGIDARSKAIALGALLYFINPIDLIPDAIPVVGYLDDLAVMTLAAAILSRNGGMASVDTPRS